MGSVSVVVMKEPGFAKSEKEILNWVYCCNADPYCSGSISSLPFLL